MADRKSCDLCPQTFATRSSLNRHRKTHSGGKRYNCSQCNKSFSQNVSLKRHFLIHTEEKPYKCAQCNFSTKQVDHLKEHIMKHTGESWYQCNQCDLTTILKLPGHLKRHKRTHSGEKLHKCTRGRGTQEKNHTSVTSASTIVLLLVICKATWQRTLGRDLSSATNALKHSHGNIKWRNISKSTLLQVRLILKYTSERF